MNLENDTWEVIDSYFRDIPNYLVRHHIDSYNDFVHNKISQILKNTEKNPPIVLLDKSDSNITYEIKIYYGGKDHTQYKLSKPTIKDYPSGEVRQLFPNEARLKDITYGSDFVMSVEIEMTMKKNGVVVFENVPVEAERFPFLKNIYVGKIPIMLRSDICVLGEASGELLAEMGEDPYDLGGYFILDGAEKTIVSQERKAENIVFLNTVTQSSGSEKYTHFAEVKCVSDEAFANARTVKVQLERTGPITVRLGQNNPLLQENKNRDVPLFIMFRALGIESDKEILQYIIGGPLEGELAEKMMDLLRPSILDPFILEEKIYDRERAEAYLVKLPTRAKQLDRKDASFSEILKNKLAKLSFLYSTFDEAFFPHISSTGNLNKAKAYYLGYVARRLLLLKLGLEEETDCDNFVNKRIDLSGFLISTLFRDAMQQFIRNVRVRTNEAYNFNAKEYSRENIVYLINESNYMHIFNRDKFKEHFNSKLKIGNIGEKKGVVQALDRGTRNGTIAHLRRIIDNIAGGRVTIPRRRLHSTQYGCVCPVETPEGQRVGLNKGLAVISHITFGCPTKSTIDFCVNKGVELLDDLEPIEVSGLCKVMVNGNWIGCHRKPEELLEVFRLYRRNGLINTFISISWERSTNEIKINTDQGRFVRPLYIIEKNSQLIQPRHINDIHNKTLTFTDLVSGFRPRKSDYNYYDCEVKDISYIGLEKTDRDYISKLRESQAVIEYVDSQEFDTTLLTIGFNVPTNTLLKYTHTELHPSLMLSVSAHLLPFTNYNQSVRSILSSKQVKQGISTYAMNFNSRIDTNGILLNNPEVPLALCRINKALRMDKIANGQNLYVAIMKYNYNQEDAIVANQSVIDMGQLNFTHFKMYSDKEMVDPKTGEMQRFYNPIYKDEMPDYPDELMPNNRANYDIIDKYGFPKQGSYIKQGDIVVGKYMKVKDEHGNEVYRDVSTDTKLGTEGTVVDKVYTCQTNEEGERMLKVRVCKQRPPKMGDKLVSRNAQKGVIGISLKKEDLPYTEDGIVPDLILDPSSYPTRMTLSQLFEILFGNLAAELGLIGIYNAFETVNIEQIGDILENKLGMTSLGNRILYNGYSGEQIETLAFSGIVYYERLKLLVDDKINTRESGDRQNGVPVPGGFYTVKERQSVAGRANGGGLKIGEMERDALLSHGIWSFIKESFIERCDKFIIHISKDSGEISVCNPETGLYYDNLNDGPVSYQLVNDGIKSKKGLVPAKIIGVNTYGQKSMDFVQVIVPYTFKLLIQEMQGMCIDIRMNVDIVRRIASRSDDTGEIVELGEEDIDEMLSYADGDEETDESQDGGFLFDEEDEKKDAEDGDENGDEDGDNNGEDGDNENQNGGSAEGTDETVDSNNTPRPQLTMLPAAPLQQQQQPAQMPVQQNGGQMPQPIVGGMAVTPDGGQQETMEVDLSQYGGVKPDFDIKARDDTNSIADLNAQLLGIQQAGSNEIIENAKTEGINNVLYNNQPVPAGNFINQQIAAQQQQQNAGGLNMSFNNPKPNINNQPLYQKMHSQMTPVQQPAMMPTQTQMGGSIGGGAGAGASPIPPLSFNNNIKVVEIDSKVSEGFFYSGSNNLDPFTNQKM